MTPDPNAITKKKHRKSLFRRVNDWLHLWLGISSGIIIVIVSLTGCLYVFQQEISDFTQPFRFVRAQAKSYLPPSALLKAATATAFGDSAGKGENNIYDIEYGTSGKAAVATYSHPKKGYTFIYLDPYTGQVLKIKYLNEDFFRIVLNGHYYLWLPEKIGQPIVATAVLIFVFLLISGLIMWWPKNLKKANRNKSFTIKWKAHFKRINYDLHNVLGFYVLLLAFCIAVTGLVWGFEWFNKSYYFTISGGKSFPGYVQQFSDTTKPHAPTTNIPGDVIWQQMMQEYPNRNVLVQIQFPKDTNSAIIAYVNDKPGTYYKGYSRYFDRYTLQEIKSNGLYDKAFSRLSAADKLYRMNYDIHIGAVLGLKGKFIAFFASLICGSLPITGFIIWWGKRRKKGEVKPVSV